MNCQKGDLAILIFPSGHPKNLGQIVEVLEPYPDDGYGPSWYVRGDGLLDPFGWPIGRKIGCCDSKLRPIRDPGPSAVDETIQRLGTPMDMRLRELESEIAKLNESLDRLEKVLTR